VWREHLRVSVEIVGGKFRLYSSDGLNFSILQFAIALKGPKQISPGQGNVSCASVAAALGQEVVGAAARKGRHIASFFLPQSSHAGEHFESSLPSSGWSGDSRKKPDAGKRRAFEFLRSVFRRDFLILEIRALIPAYWTICDDR